MVDSGAARLVIPQKLAEQLGLEHSGKTRVKFADGRSAQRDMVDHVRLRWNDRSGVFTASVEPTRTEPLIGAIVMEDLDLLIDCTRQQLVPRDPKQIVSEVE